MTTVNLTTAQAGDRVYNSRAGRWGLVVSTDKDEVTGAVLRVRVKPSLSPRPGWAWDARWWNAGSITDHAQGGARAQEGS